MATPSNPFGPGNSSKPGEIIKGKCAVCGASSVLRCKACGLEGESIFYCTKEHQVQDWSPKGSHRPVCAATVNSKAGFVTKKDPNPNTEIGLTYHAARDLPVGHLLFSKSPLVIVPRAPNTADADVMAKLRSTIAYEIAMGFAELCTCVGCIELLPYGYIVDDPPRPKSRGKCGKCSWPLHARMEPEDEATPCEKIHEKECETLAKAGLTWQKIRGSRVAYLLIGVLRALALPEDELAAFFKIPLRAWTPEDAETEEVFNWLKICGFNLKKGVVHMYIMKIQTNMLPFPYSPVPNAKLGFVIYKGPTTGSGRIFSHSCTPNVTLIFDPITMEGHFKTLRPVKKGEELRQSYLFHFEVYQSVDCRKMRLAELVTSCDCRRCSDPATEGGTYFTAIKCGRGPDHWFLRRVRQNVNEIDLFHCSKCKATKRVAEVNLIIRAMDGELDRGNYDSIKSFLVKYSGNVVHPNHFTCLIAWIHVGIHVNNFIMTDCKSPPSEIGFDLHKKYLADLDRVLELMAVIHPGRVQLTGQFLFGRSLLLMSQLAEEISKQKPDLPDVIDVEARLAKIMGEAQEAWTILTEAPLVIFSALRHYKTIRTVYANHLVTALNSMIFPAPAQENGDGNDKPSKFEEFKQEYADLVEFDNTKMADVHYSFTNPNPLATRQTPAPPLEPFRLPTEAGRPGTFLIHYP